MIEGPLALARRPGQLAVRIESSALDAGDPPTPARVDTWVAQDVHVAGRPEWVFVKVHTHGAPERERRVPARADAGRPLHEHLAARYNDGRRWALHYVTAREMFNIAMAAMEGASGRSRRVPRPRDRATAGRGPLACSRRRVLRADPRRLPAAAGVPPVLRAFRLLHVTTALAMLGLVLDLRLGVSRPIRRPAAAPDDPLRALVPGHPGGACARGARERARGAPHPARDLPARGAGHPDLRGLQILAGLLLAIGVALAAIGVDQGLSDWGCHRIELGGGPRGPRLRRATLQRGGSERLRGRGRRARRRLQVREGRPVRHAVDPRPRALPRDPGGPERAGAGDRHRPPVRAGLPRPAPLGASGPSWSPWPSG